jgi:hypothetical protein
MAGKKIGPAGLKFIAQRAGIEFSATDKIPIELVMGFMDMDFDTMLWIWGYGLNWDGSGAKMAEAKDLYDTYMEEGEDLDDGEKFRSFKSMAVDAINVARGIDTKKLIEKNKTDRENAIIEEERTRLRTLELRKRAQEELGDPSIGKPQPDSALET